MADFTECQDPYFFVRIFKELDGLDISILVNNVGISNIGYFHEIPDKRILNEINVNIIPMTMMSHNIIPQMLKRKHRSAIINISSFSAEHPIPYVSNYSATKVYNDFFSRAIEMEYHDPEGAKQFKTFATIIVFLAIFGVVLFNKFVMGKVLHKIVHS